MPKTLRTPAHSALLASLTSHRKGREITQQELANMLQRPQSYVAKVETGERRIDAVELVQWAVALKLDVAQILEPVVAAFQSDTAASSFQDER